MDEDNNPFTGPMLPLTLIAATGIMFLLSQLGSIKQGTQTMNWQNESADSLLVKLKETRKTLDESVENNKALVAQSEQTQKQFTDMMKELNDYAVAGDKDADLIIKGYGIKVADNASSAPAEKKDEAGAEKKAE